jgi:hypothetical protein
MPVKRIIHVIREPQSNQLEIGISVFFRKVPAFRTVPLLAQESIKVGARSAQPRFKPTIWEIGLVPPIRNSSLIGQSRGSDPLRCRSARPLGKTKQRRAQTVIRKMGEHREKQSRRACCRSITFPGWLAVVVPNEEDAGP